MRVLLIRPKLHPTHEEQTDTASSFKHTIGSAGAPPLSGRKAPVKFKMIATDHHIYYYYTVDIVERKMTPPRPLKQLVLSNPEGYEQVF